MILQTKEGNLENQSQTILIVDDAKEDILVLSRLLKDQANIIFATSGEDGLQKTLAHRPDLILLDISMPGMDGFEVLRHLTTNPETAEIPVIFVTVIPDTQNEEKGLNLGAVDYITKPFAPVVVRARVRIHLKLRSVALALKEANTRLTHMAMTDPLTGVFNRRHFLEAAAIELVRLRRHHHPVSLIIMDIDHFKTVNDRYGHDIGDRVLVHTAEACSSLLRINDVFGRIGGEEFTALLPETQLEEAEQIAKRLCALLSETRIETSYGRLTYTASFGVTPIRESDQTCQQALKRADQALYHAKHNGRNQVAIFDDDQTVRRHGGTQKNSN